ncbi:MAG: agmatine deiminase family protein [Oligoflexus sp.]
MKLMKLLGHIGMVAFVSACGASAPVKDSNLDGHYENATAAEMNAFIGQQSVVPEYAPVNKVIVGLPVLTVYRQEALIEEIFKAGVDQVLISHSARNRNLTTEDGIFNRLAERLEGVQTRDSTGMTTRTNRIKDIMLVSHNTRGFSNRDEITTWARDWAPLGAAITSGSSAGNMRLLDFNYYYHRQLDDYSSQAYAEAKSLDRVSVPVYNEGGNFMNDDDGVCLMTERVVEANNARNAYFPEDQVYSQGQIKDFYRDFAGCKGVTIFERMPYEGTGHIDMWSKLLDNNTIMIGEYRENTLDTISHVVERNGQRVRVALQGFEEEFNAASAIQRFLEEQARKIEFEGVDITDANGFKTKKFYKIVRVPMPAPSETSDGSLVFRSYTNSLFVNGSAIVPQYLSGYGSIYPDQSLRAAYEAEVTSVYRAAGYRVAFVPTDNLIRSGGAVHCVTMQLPKL